MGWAMALSNCIGCGVPFMFNPHKVPSIRVNGIREPVCKGCVERANPARIANGLPPFTPAADAYEPLDESVL